MRQPRVLVADDEALNLEIIRECLHGSGFELVMVGDGEAAWRLLAPEDSDFDAIVLDRMMPRADGMEVLRRMQEHPRLSDIPVVMQTAAATPEQIGQGLQAGARYYLTKPYEPEALMAVVKSAVMESLRRREVLQHAQSRRLVMMGVQQAEFRFASLDEAAELASLAALAAPTPETAVMGLSELLINAIEHGNLGITYDEKCKLKLEERWEEEVGRRLRLPENAGRFATLRMERTDSELRYAVYDMGSGFDWSKYLEFDPARAFDPNGRGIAMARQLCFDALTYEGNGSSVVAVIELK